MLLSVEFYFLIFFQRESFFSGWRGMDILGAEYVKVLFPNHFCRKMIIITFAAIV